MYPVYDIDALVLLSVALSAKRRPAELAEVLAAQELIAGAVADEQELTAAFARLSTNGLICEAGGGFELTRQAQTIIAAQSRKADNAQRLLDIGAKLASCNAELPPILVTQERFAAAMQAHKASHAHAGKNLLVPRVKPDESKNSGKRRPLARRRKY